MWIIFFILAAEIAVPALSVLNVMPKNGTELLLPTNSCISLNVTTGNISENIAISIDNITVSNIFVFSSEIIELAPDHFSSYGTHEVILKGSSSFFWFPLRYEEAIGKLSVYPPQSMFSHEATINFTVSVNNGSNLLLHVFIVSNASFKFLTCFQNGRTFIVPYDFKSCQNYNLQFSLSNGIYTRSLQKKVTVIPSAKLFNVTFLNLYIVAPDSLQISIQYAECSLNQKNVTATLVVDSQAENPLTLLETNQTVSKKYLQLGKHNITIVIKTPIDSNVISEIVTVATNTTLETGKKEYSIGDKVYFFVNESTIPVDLFKINISDGVSNYYFENSSDVMGIFFKEYHREGIYNISWTLSCPYFSKSGALQIFVYGILTNVTVDDKSIIIPDGLREFDINVKSNGSISGKCVVSYGDGTRQNITNLMFPTNFTIQKNYTNENNFTFHVTCITKMNSVNATALTEVTKFDLQYFSLNYSTIVPLGKDCDFLLSYRGNKDNLPNFVTTKWDFGDGDNTKNKLLSSYNKTHMYKTFGNYSGLLTLAGLNQMRNITFNIQVGIFYFYIENTTIFANDVGISGSFALVYPAFTTDPEITYEITFSSEKHIEVCKKKINLIAQNMTFNCQIKLIGIYNIDVKINGSTFEENFEFNRTLLVINRITDLQLGAPEKLASYETLTLNVTAGLKTQEVNNITCEFTLSSGQNQTKLGDITNTSIIEVTFKSFPIGQIAIDVKCFNELSFENLFTNVTVISDCFMSNALFMNKNQIPSDPLQLQSNEDNIIKSNVELEEKCETLQMSYVWTFQNKTVRNNASYLIDKNEKPGMYRIDLSVMLNNITLTDRVYIYINLPDPVAIIKGGSVIMTPKENLIVDAGSLSYDPNQGQGKTTGLQYSWSCRTEFSNSFNPNFNTNAVNFSGNARGNGCPSLNDNSKLQVSSSELEVKKWYIFQVQVNKDNRTAIARQAVFVTPQKIIPLQISCVVNCLQKTVANVEAIFKVEFTTTSLPSPKETPSYKWKLSRTNSKQNILPLPEGNTKPDVKLPASLLEEDVSYHLEVILDNLNGYNKSYAILDLKTNKAPENGSCTVDPMNGTAANTFNINCFDWQDPDGIWKYVIVFEVKENRFIIDETMQTISSGYRFPIGDENDDYQGALVIRVYDNFKAYSQINYTIQVKPDESAAENLLNGSNLQERIINNPDALMQNSENVISILNTIKIPVSNKIKEIQEENINEIFSQNASQVNKEWDSIINSFSVKKDEKQDQLEKNLNEMTRFLTEQVISNPPLNDIGIQEKSEIFISLFERQNVSHLNSSDIAMKATTKIGESLFELSQRKPVELGINSSIHSVTNFIGTILNQITPDDPLPSEPMTMDMIRKKIEQKFPNPDSSISIEERAFLALKEYQQEILQQKKQHEVSRSAIPEMMKTINQIDDAMSSLAVKDGLPVIQISKQLKIGKWKVSPKASSQMFQLPSNENVQVDSIQSTDISLVAFKKNPFAYAAGSGNLKDVISFNQKSGSNKTQERTSGTVTIGFSQENITWKWIQPKSNNSKMIFHIFNYRSKAEKACVKVMPTDRYLGYIVYMRSHVHPTIKDFNYRTVVEPSNLTDGVYTICFPDNAILKTGKIYVGLQPLEIMGHQRHKRSTDNRTEMINTTYSFGSLVAGCSVLDDKNDKWTSNDCKPKYNKEKNAVECECNNPVSTIFSNSFYVPPNVIDFSTVFNKFDLVNNGAVFGVVIAFISIYLILLVITRHYDRKDFIRWSIIPLVDSVDTDPFWYVISVYTGLQYGSGTKSRISFKIAGENVDTQVHSLTDGHQKEFKTGSILKFFMSTNELLGDIQYLYIWHDNSGSGDNASWYLNKIEITDLQTHESYVFLCNSWLAVEEGDGLISRVLPVSTGNDLLSFNNKFFEHTRQKITDEHIWLSIVFRPSESPFNRKKRLSTAFALLFLTMISNAMFYSKPAQVIEIGPIRFSYTMLWTSFMGIIISTFPIVLIMTLFKKSKHRHHSRKNSSSGEVAEESFLSTEELVATNRKVTGDFYEESNGVRLPWFCAYIAWVLTALSILASAIFIILYSQEWGKEKSEEWLTTFFLSFFESCFIVDPLKVIVVSIILSFFSKKLIKNNIAQKKIEKINNYGEILPPSCNPPLGQNIIKQARAKRRGDLRMREAIHDIFLYVVFLWVIYSLSLDNRDPHAFEQSQQLDKLFYVTKEFKQVHTNRQLLKWINTTFFSNFFPQTNYKGTTLQPLRKLFISDQTNFRMGPARFRLLRMRSETCKIPYIGTVKCFDNYNILTEDTDGYCIKWKPPPCPPDQELTHLTFPAWNFTSATKIWGIPIMGTFSLYGGGGYILNLEINLPISIKMMEEITKNLWIDRKSRALFIEFTLYNANVNLFTYVVLLAEIPNIGEILPYTFFYSFKALADENDGMIFIYQLLFLAFILMILIRSFLRMFHMKWTFFSEIWYVLDFLSSLSCGAATGMYIMRSLMVKQAQENLKADPKKFINFYHIVVWDQIFVALMAMLVFLSTIRFLRILGYNKRISAIGLVITSAKKEMASFFILFIIIFWTFSNFGYLIFGRNLASYKSIWNSMTAMFVGILGKTHFSNLRQTRNYFGPLFYLSFVFVFIFFLLKMVESILNDSIQNVNNQIADQEQSISRYLYNQMPKYIRKTLFPEREIVFAKTGPEFCDVQIEPETKNDLPKKGETDATVDLKNLNLSSFDMMYHLINKNHEDCFKDIYADNERLKMKF